MGPTLEDADDTRDGDGEPSSSPCLMHEFADELLRRPLDWETVRAFRKGKRADLLAAAGTLSVEELRSPDGWSWVYDCLHGHTRKHLAMLGPWCAAIDWPSEP